MTITDWHIMKLLLPVTVAIFACVRSEERWVRSVLFSFGGKFLRLIIVRDLQARASSGASHGSCSRCPRRCCRARTRRSAWRSTRPLCRSACRSTWRSRTGTIFCHTPCCQVSRRWRRKAVLIGRNGGRFKIAEKVIETVLKSTRLVLKRLRQRNWFKMAAGWKLQKKWKFKMSPIFDFTTIIQTVMKSTGLSLTTLLYTRTFSYLWLFQNGGRLKMAETKNA